MKNYLLIVICILSFSAINAQGGARIFAGLTSVHNNNVNITKPGQMQSGYTIGIQSRLKDGTFVAGPGFRYTRITMMSSPEAKFFNKEENYHFLTMPMNVGLEYRLSYILKLRLYTGADMTYFYKIDDNDREINYDYVKDYFFGAHAGVGVDIYWVTFDIRYERGLTNAHKFDNSQYNFLTATAGFFF